MREIEPEEFPQDIPHPSDHFAKLQSFKQLRFKNFTLRTDNVRDSFCVMHLQKYVRLRKVLRDPNTGAIYLLGNRFMMPRSLFTVDLPKMKVTSMDVGITICNRPDSNLHSYLLSDLNEKCYAQPFKLDGSKNVNEEGDWVLCQYLH